MVYLGLTVGPASPPRGVSRWLSPVTDSLFTKSRSEPRNALVPGGFAAIMFPMIIDSSAFPKVGRRLIVLYDLT